MFRVSPFLLIFFLLAACSYSSKTQKKLYRAIEHEEFDAIIVPGVPFEDGKWDRTMKGRVYWSKWLYDNGIARNIIYSGGAVYSPYYEAKIMSLYAEALGIPPEHIFTDTLAEHTTENVYYSWKLANKLGFRRLALASDPSQTKMMKSFIRKKLNGSIPVIPFVVDTLKKIEPDMIDPVIDYDQAHKENFVSIVEKQGLWKRRRGTLGKNIDTTVYDK
jgi:uncharacterized SAM-binding protein YcdF (DUF218 family)